MLKSIDRFEEDRLNKLVILLLTGDGTIRNPSLFVK